MKKIVKYYFLELFYCLLIGVCSALAKYISAWFVILMIIPIVKSIILKDLTKELDKEPEKACAFVDTAFLGLVAALIAGSYFLSDGGCVAGGGGPKTTKINNNTKTIRSNSIYKADRKCKRKSSYQNPKIKKIYKELLGRPGSDIAEELLHNK